jgi:acyl-coenzyme A synthetase/AMP-(fatty) acid ligase
LGTFAQRYQTGFALNSLSLFPRHDGRQPVYVDQQKILDRDTFMGMARALAAQLPEQTHCLNLCDDRLSFMLSFSAALLRRQCTVLPANRTEASLVDMTANHPGITALCDNQQTFSGIPCLQVDALSLGTFLSDQNEVMSPSTLAAELFTSGSSGAPLPHRKTWGMLAQGASIVANELDIQGTLLSSVPSQHMFGLESTIMLPMQSGLVLAGGCPLLPQDILAALQPLSTPIWWATTPLHLRACVQSGLKFPKLAGILCATQTLSPDLARAAEDCFQSPLHEIYGCTEAGAIGIRRPAHSEIWRLLGDFEMSGHNGATRISGIRCKEELCLPDHIDVLGDRHFRLLGRHANLIKVGGKRMHLDALNQILLSIPGVRDGIFFQPVEGGRLTALVVAAEPDTSALMTELRKQIDPVFLPRPIHWVQSLPRNALGKLPMQALKRLLEELS